MPDLVSQNGSGSKHHFRKVTITLPPEAYKQLVTECARRKVSGERNHLISALVRDALASYFDRQGSGLPTESA